MLDSYYSFWSDKKGCSDEIDCSTINNIGMTFVIIISYLFIFLYGSLKFLYLFSDFDEDFGNHDENLINLKNKYNLDNNESNDRREGFQAKQNEIWGKFNGNNVAHKGGAFPNGDCKSGTKGDEDSSIGADNNVSKETFLQIIERQMINFESIAKNILCFQTNFSKINEFLVNQLYKLENINILYFLFILLIPLLQVLYSVFGSFYFSSRGLIEELEKTVRNFLKKNDGDENTQPKFSNIQKNKLLTMWLKNGNKKFLYAFLGYIVSSIVTYLIFAQLISTTGKNKNPIEWLMSGELGDTVKKQDGGEDWGTKIIKYTFGTLLFFLFLPIFLFQKICEGLGKFDFFKNSFDSSGRFGFVRILMAIYLLPLWGFEALGKINQGENGEKLLAWLLPLIMFGGVGLVGTIEKMLDSSTRGEADSDAGQGSDGILKTLDTLFQGLTFLVFGTLFGVITYFKNVQKKEYWSSGLFYLLSMFILIILFLLGVKSAPIIALVFNALLGIYTKMGFNIPQLPHHMEYKKNKWFYGEYWETIKKFFKFGWNSILYIPLVVFLFSFFLSGFFAKLLGIPILSMAFNILWTIASIAFPLNLVFNERNFLPGLQFFFASWPKIFSNIFVVFCLGIALLIGAMSYKMAKNDPDGKDYLKKSFMWKDNWETPKSSGTIAYTSFGTIFVLSMLGISHKLMNVASDAGGQ